MVSLTYGSTLRVIGHLTGNPPKAPTSALSLYGLTTLARL